MGWETAERTSLATSAALLVACAITGFRWVKTPYFKGYASAAAACFVFSRLAGRLR